MIYQVRANLYFWQEDEARDFYHDCELALRKATAVNPDTDEAEYAAIEFIENHHDSNPNEPCQLVSTGTNKPVIARD